MTSVVFGVQGRRKALISKGFAARKSHIPKMPRSKRAKMGYGFSSCFYKSEMDLSAF